MDIFKAGEGRIKYITLNNDTIKRSADRKVGRAFLYVYMYILAILKNRTNAGVASLCACTVFVMCRKVLSSLKYSCKNTQKNALFLH